jgi:hypothetical protein
MIACDSMRNLISNESRLQLIHPRACLWQVQSPPDTPSVSASITPYACLEQRFYARLAPKPVAAPRLVKRNVKLDPNLGIDVDALMSAEGIDILGATA